MHSLTWKTFGRVPREVTTWALRKVGVKMTMYDGALTVVRTLDGNGDGFEVKVGLHQGSVAVYDSNGRCFQRGVGWTAMGVLYADDLVLMAESEVEFKHELVVRWKNRMEAKDLTVNVVTQHMVREDYEFGPKVMAVGECLDTIKEDGSHSCRVCGKGVWDKSVRCTSCSKWVHR